ncbi:hypothetical protein OG824_31815 [Streptomyces prunicolor]|uniref:hypothetical protein n=1 Tax=Streptomyces prunicolor TaxID=67348 RepID=UPI00224FCB18|nr:hypothetical protein [Streptomyces prunicolor]MCX5239798.1 hypothetical protein [Streptomyces prunicolor]
MTQASELPVPHALWEYLREVRETFEVKLREAGVRTSIRSQVELTIDVHFQNIDAAEIGDQLSYLDFMFRLCAATTLKLEKEEAPTITRPLPHKELSLEVVSAEPVNSLNVRLRVMTTLAALAELLAVFNGAVEAGRTVDGWVNTSTVMVEHPRGDSISIDVPMPSPEAARQACLFAGDPEDTEPVEITGQTADGATLTFITRWPMHGKHNPDDDARMALIIKLIQGAPDDSNSPKQREAGR